MKFLFFFLPAIVRASGLGLLLGAFALHAQAQANAAPGAATSATTPAAAALLTPGDNREGTFKIVQGDVTVVRGNTRSAAVVGGGLQQSDRVVTGPKSATALVLKDGTTLSIGPDSSVNLSEYQFNATTHEGNVLVALAHGSLRMVTGLIARLKPEQVKVTTPTTVIGVRGTDFIVEERP